MTKNLTLAMLGILTACTGLFALPLQAQVSVGYAPIAPPMQEGGYAANNRPFTVASAYDGPPAAATRVAPSATAPAIETVYRPAVYAPTPAVNYYPAAPVQTASYQPATASYLRPAMNTSTAPVSYIQPVRSNYPTSYVPASTGVPTYVQPTNYVQPIGTSVPAGQVMQTQALAPVAAGTAIAGGNPCCCPTTGYSPAVGAYVAPSIAPGYAVAAQRDYAYSPLVALRPMPSDYTVGQGLLGQPKVYVEGEPVRNFFRYILP